MENQTVRLEATGGKFRVLSPRFNTAWLPDTPENRQTMLVSLRSLKDDRGRNLFTLKELAAVVDSPNRQAASTHMQEFRACGEEFRAFLERKRKVDAGVVAAARQELLDAPLSTLDDLARRTNARLGRDDLNKQNIAAALDHIPCRPALEAVRRRVAEGKAHYREGPLLETIMADLSADAGREAGLAPAPVSRGMTASDPTAVKTLLDPKASLGDVSSTLGTIVFVMTLYYWNVPLSVLGSWLGVNKTTILRWRAGTALAVWPTIFGWIQERVNARTVYIDEKWIKIKKRWHYWFVVLDRDSELPVASALLPSSGKWACRWVGRLLERLKKVPNTIITDGLAAYEHLLPRVRHLRCHFHLLQNVSGWLRRHFDSPEDIAARKPLMKKVLQTNDKRTVLRRLKKLKQRAKELGIEGWTDYVTEKLPNILPGTGSRRFPATTNAVERFFRAFNRFYKTRGGFHSVSSANTQLVLFQVVHLFSKRPGKGTAPIEAIMPEAKNMPIYKLINDPFNALKELRNVKRSAAMANSLLFDSTAAL